MHRTLCRLLCVFAAGVLMLAGGCGPMIVAVGVAPGDQRLTSTAVSRDGELGSGHIAIVDVSGMIYNADKPGLLSSGENPVSLLTETLAACAADTKVKAVVLRVNSPGGTVTASDAMYREVMRFRAQTGKPVVVLMMDVAASGGYYLALAGDHIIAYPTTVTASVGVIMQTMSFKPALTRIGVQTEAFTSGPNKDAGSPLATMTDEHRAVLSALVDDFYKQFAQHVRERRPQIPADQFDTVTDGRILSGTQAQQLGMVDELGDLHDALIKARDMAGLDQADVVIFHRTLQYVGSPYAQAPAAQTGTQINVGQVNLSRMPSEMSAGFYYLWTPGGP